MYDHFLPPNSLTSVMRQVLLFITFLALSGVALSSPYGKDDALLELKDALRVSIQEDDDDTNERKDETDALSALINSYSEIQNDDIEDNVQIEGFISKVGKIFKILKKVGNVLHSNFGHVPIVRKYSKYLRCLPTFQEQIELATMESDNEDLDVLLNSLEAQAQGNEEIAEVEFFKKLFKKAKRFGHKVWNKVKKVGKKALKVIRAVRNYLRCIKRSIEVRSKEEMKQVEQQAMQFLQNAITARVVRL